MKKSAELSECKKYRFSLSRIWDEEKPVVLFLMLNPSTADAEIDDPTIRRCIGFAKSWDFGGLHVCNLYAYRATNPLHLLNHHNDYGEFKNSGFINKYASLSEKIICAWGNESILNKIGNQTAITEFLYAFKDKLHYLELSKKGTPKHPLYLKKELIPIKLF